MEMQRLAILCRCILWICTGTGHTVEVHRNWPYCGNAQTGQTVKIHNSIGSHEVNLSSSVGKRFKVSLQVHYAIRQHLISNCIKISKTEFNLRHRTVYKELLQ